jgi:hypothetical protein
MTDYFNASLEDLLVRKGFRLEFSYTVNPSTKDSHEVFVLSHEGSVFEWSNDGLGALDTFFEIPSQSELQGYVDDWEYIQEKYRDLVRSVRD